MRLIASVQSIYDVLRKGNLKRDALFFDRLIINMAGNFIPELQEHPNGAEIWDEIEWLTSSEIVDPVHDYFQFLQAPLGSDLDKRLRVCDSYLMKLGTTDISPDHFLKTYHDIQNRALAILSRDLDWIDILPYSKLPIPLFDDVAPRTIRSDVIEITVNFLPYPDDNVAWEQILEFRSDPDSKAKFIDLRNWINETAAGNLPPVEIEEKLEYLYSQFQRHIALHRLKTNQSAVETVVIPAAEIAEDLVKFKWGKLATSLFAIKKRSVDLMEAELTSPGNQVAYLYKAKETFK